MRIKQSFFVGEISFIVFREFIKKRKFHSIINYSALKGFFLSEEKIKIFIWLNLALHSKTEWRILTIERSWKKTSKNCMEKLHGKTLQGRESIFRCVALKSGNMLINVQ